MDMDSLQRAVLARQLRMDPPPYDRAAGKVAERVTIEVECTPTQHVCAGQMFTAGIAIYEVWSTDLDAIQAQVDDADETSLAMVDRDLANHQANRAAGKVMRDRPYSPSWPASFRRVMDRDPRPFRSCKVLSDDKPAPKKRGAA